MANPLIGWLRGRQSSTQSTAALWTTALVDMVVFFAIFMIALPWLAHWLYPRAIPLPAVVRTWSSVLLIGAGLVGCGVCLEAFVSRGRGTPLPAEAPSRLVSDGLFAIVRNPIIVSEAMVIWGEALYVGSVGLVVYAVLFCVAGQLVVVYVEEPVLRKRFGESYERYCRAVPRWFPSVRGRRNG